MRSAIRCRSHLSNLLLLALLLLPSLALAHPMAPDLTVAQLRIHYHLIELTLRGPSSEMLSAAEVQATDLVGEETQKPIIAKITKWLPSSFMIAKDGKPLAPIVVDTGYQNYPIGPEYSLTVHYATDKPAEHLRITSKFVHTIVSAGGVQFELRSDKETTRDFDTGANLTNLWNNVIDFMQMGMEHLFTGPDHILFICTLIFALMDFRSVVKMLTGFTVGHSITLILSTFNVIHISPRLADIGIALTIVYVGVENILRQEQAKNRWLLVTMFGLIHGMGFSSALREVGLPEQGLVLCLLSFNLGIEFAQIIIVAMVYPLLTRIRWFYEAKAIDREQGTRQFKMLLNAGSALTACMGCYWFVERLMGH